MNILAIVGSPRINGNTNYLTDQALQEAANLGAKTEKIILSEYKLNPCLGHQNCSECESCLQQDDGMSILRKFTEADGIILATPVYYYDISAWMKIFIDRNYFLYRHSSKCNAKTIGIIVVAGGAGIKDTLNTFNKFINASTFDIAENNKYYVTGYANNPGEVKNNNKLVEEAKNLGKQMVKALKL